MGPRLFNLPILLALAYVGMGYCSWIVALTILRHQNRAVSGRMTFLVPLFASFVMMAWDLSMEPVWTNIDRAWTWRNGGPYFGVPVSNFLGWFLTVYVFYQLFALYLRDRAAIPCRDAYWRLAIIFYGLSAVGNLLVAVPVWMPKVIVDASDRSWMVSHILWASHLVSVFVMMPLALIAWTGTSAGITAESYDSAISSA